MGCPILLRVGHPSFQLTFNLFSLAFSGHRIAVFSSTVAPSAAPASHSRRRFYFHHSQSLRTPEASRSLGESASLAVASSLVSALPLSE